MSSAADLQGEKRAVTNFVVRHLRNVVLMSSAPGIADRRVMPQVMRHDVSLALGKTGPNVDVMCTDKRFGGRFLTFVQVSVYFHPFEDPLMLSLLMYTLESPILSLDTP